MQIEFVLNSFNKCSLVTSKWEQHCDKKHECKL